MRAMAKKVQSMREKKAAEDDRNSKRRQSREYRGRSSRHRNRDAEKCEENPHGQYHQEENPLSNFAITPLTEWQAVNLSQGEQNIHKSWCLTFTFVAISNCLFIDFPFILS